MEMDLREVASWYKTVSSIQHERAEQINRQRSG
jgi:hypothetical protein